LVWEGHVSLRTLLQHLRVNNNLKVRQEQSWRWGDSRGTYIPGHQSPCHDHLLIPAGACWLPSACSLQKKHEKLLFALLRGEESPLQLPGEGITAPGMGKDLPGEPGKLSAHGVQAADPPKRRAWECNLEVFWVLLQMRDPVKA